MFLGMVKLKAHTDAISGNQSKQQFSMAFYLSNTSLQGLTKVSAGTNNYNFFMGIIVPIWKTSFCIGVPLKGNALILRNLDTMSKTFSGV